MPAVPTPPVDASGGIMVVQYTNGTDTHRARIHVPSFNYGSGTNWVYNPVVGSGVEAQISDTFAALCAVLKPAYNTAWTFSLLAVAQIVGGIPVQRFGWPIPATVAGTYAGSSPLTNQQRAGQTSFNGKTLLGGRNRLTLIGCNYYASSLNNAPYVPSSGVDSVGDAIRAYLSNANTAIVGHDGAKLSAYGPRITFCVNKRLRRRYGYA